MLTCLYPFNSLDQNNMFNGNNNFQFYFNGLPTNGLGQFISSFFMGNTNGRNNQGNNNQPGNVPPNRRRSMIFSIFPIFFVLLLPSLISMFSNIMEFVFTLAFGSVFDLYDPTDYGISIQTIFSYNWGFIICLL